MNPDTMTAEEIRDELARMDGWHQLTADGWVNPKTRIIGDNPHPPTLDGAHAAMPEGYWLCITRWNRHMGTDMEWSGNAGRVGVDGANPSVTTAPDRLTAEWRLALKCRLAEKGTENV